MGNDTFGAAFGRLVKAKRAEHRLTQGQLAELVWPGDSDAAEKRKGDISKLETGKTPNPQASTVKRIAEVLSITEAEIDALRKQVQMSPQEQLDAVPTLSRNQLELLANRFEMERAFDRSDDELRGFVEGKAEEYRALKSEVDAIDERTKGLGNLQAAAQDAAKNLDFEEVEMLLSRVQEVELEVAAETAELRARNALLRGKVEQAYTILSAAADSFGAVDPLEPAQRRHNYAKHLYQHGLRYGGEGLKFAAESWRRAAGGFGEFAQPVDWGKSTQNLGVALQEQGIRITGPEGAALFAEAVESFRAALRVRTEADHPVDWAMTMQNLGIALKEQGNRMAGPKGAALLAEAVESYRAALRVCTEADHPVDWAMVMLNLGVALYEQGIRMEGAEGAALLGETLESFRAALRVQTEADHPVYWAKTQENMAELEEARADHDTCTDPRPHLEAGLAHVEAALTVFDPEHMPYNFEKATKLRDRLRARLAALDE